MATLPERAAQLRQQAEDRGICRNEAKNVKRKLEDFSEAGSVAGLLAGGALIVVGGIVAFFIPPLGLGIAVGGAVALGLSADNYASALKKAKKELERAIEDLEECIERHP